MNRPDRAQGRFPATGAGYDTAVDFVDAHSEPTERAWAIEGTASYGRDLTAALAARGEWVIEFDRPARKTKDGATSDHLDAVRAARETLGRNRHSQPRAYDGIREATGCTPWPGPRRRERGPPRSTSSGQ